MVFHNEDGNPARANIKQALGYLKDGDGDGNSQPHKGVKASANSDVMYSFTSAQDGNPLQDDVRSCLGDDLKKAQDHSQRQAGIDQRTSAHMVAPSKVPMLQTRLLREFGRGNATQRNLLKQQYGNFTTSSLKVLDQPFDGFRRLISQCRSWLKVFHKKIGESEVLRSQPKSPQLDNEDLQQIHPDDLEEMDLR
ncbi:hypothetical protein Tco_0733931 [Tanacetum coccineum]